MAFTKRGLRIVEGLKKYAREKPLYYDTANAIRKLNFTAANEDVIRAHLTVDRSMCNGYDVMHGGFIALLTDVMCLYGYVAKTGGKLAYTTHISINFLNTAVNGDKVIAEATTLRGGPFPVMESKLYKENGCLIAKSTASFAVGNEKLQLLAPAKFGYDILQVILLLDCYLYRLREKVSKRNKIY